MDGTAELAQLAHLLRLGADTARQIAGFRKADSERINALAREAERMALDLDEIVGCSHRSERRAVQ